MAYSKGIVTIPNVTGNIEIIVETTDSGYVNLFDSTADGFVQESTTKFYTNYIPCANGDVIHIKGATPYKYSRFDSNKGAVGSAIYCTNAGLTTSNYDSNVQTMVAGQISADGTIGDVAISYIRFEFRVALPSELIITVNQDIVEGSKPSCTNLFNVDEATLNTRFTSSSTTSQDGVYITGYIDAVPGDDIYVKPAFTYASSTPYDKVNCYNSTSDTKIGAKVLADSDNGASNIAFNVSNGVGHFTVPEVSGTTRIKIALRYNEGLTTITSSDLANVVITKNESIS